MSISLEFRNVTKLYQAADQPAVQGVNLSLNEGEILSLIGESGSGKTTLLRLAVGLEAPDKGEIYLGDELVAGPQDWVPPERRGIGLVFQDDALFPHLTVEANLTYGLHNKTNVERQAVVQSLLGMVGLAGMERRFPHELSGGERQRLAIARALAPHPRVILLDEPFGNLDPALRLSMREEIRSLLSKLKATVIFVTHDPEDSLAVSARIAILRDGSIEQIGTPKEIYRNPLNEYCACLFGPANCVQESENKLRWIRPEQIRMSWQGESGLIKSKVVRTHHAGKHQDVYIRPLNPNLAGDQGVWLLYHDSDESIQEGATVWVNIE